MADLDPAKRASELILHVETAAREVYMAAGRGVILGQGGAKRIMDLLSDHLTPDTAECVRQEIVPFLQL